MGGIGADRPNEPGCGGSLPLGARAVERHPVYRASGGGRLADAATCLILPCAFSPLLCLPTSWEIYQRAGAGRREGPPAVRRWPLWFVHALALHYALPTTGDSKHQERVRESCLCGVP